ncbi:MAG: pitrilysin family protein [Thermaerobacter sp.]|nr:pitrilysin family protein [Thermaerobacter sp.]
MVRTTLPSGLEVVVMPRPGQRRTYATFATYYGSIDSHFRVPTTGADLEVPDGIAHFLEHKMFAKPEGDVMDQFAALGASTNAYTEYLTTSYLFSTTDRVAECLTILMDLVQRPHFTEENVQKEQGIIEQELRMYLDMPGDRVHSNLMRALYQKHPVRLDIGGSVASIRTITPDVLYRCYETFYHPSNMLLFVVGDLDPQQVIDQIAEAQWDKGLTESQAEIVRYLPDEPDPVAEAWVEQVMPVSLPLVSIGYKDPVSRLEGQDLLTREVVSDVMWGVLLGKASPLWSRLYEEGLINDRFGAHYTAATTYAYSSMGGETPHPERLAEVLAEELARVAITAEDVERQKKSQWGGFATLFNSPGDLAYQYNAWHFRGVDLFQFSDALASVSHKDVEARRDEHLQPVHRAISVIRPESS